MSEGLLNKLRKSGKDGWVFWCPGCDSVHRVDDTWSVDPTAVTINPSVLVNGADLGKPTEPMQPWNMRCHSFVKDGKIQFLDDCDHKLKGQTVELPYVEEKWA